MSWWMYQSDDPLVFRDGRPFGTSASGNRADSLPMPLPPTLAGATRSAIARAAGWSFRGPGAKESVARVLSVGVRGPVVLRQEPTGWSPCFAWPADAIAPRDGSSAGARVVVRLAPEPVPDATWIVDQGAGPGGLQLCAPLAPIAGKVRSPEHLWTTRAMARWMLSPPNTAQNLEVGSDLEPLPVREERTHVGIGTSGTARENHLFQTVGLRFPPSVGLGVRVEAPPVCGDLPEDFGLCPLGGERRGAWLRSVALGPVPDFSEAGKVLSRTRRLRIVLVTPAVWTGGWLPDGLGVQGSLVRGRLAGRGPEVRLVAACVGRWTAISGWDLQLRKPKPLRRAAPAGSVFFFELEQALSAEAATELLRSLWLGPGLCESARDVLDGFAVPVAGIW